MLKPSHNPGKTCVKLKGADEITGTWDLRNFMSQDNERSGPSVYQVHNFSSRHLLN